MPENDTARLRPPPPDLNAIYHVLLSIDLKLGVLEHMASRVGGIENELDEIRKALLRREER